MPKLMINKAFSSVITITLCLSFLFCSDVFAAINNINTGQSLNSDSFSLTNNDSVQFIGSSGTLNITATEVAKSILTNSNGVGILDFNTIGGSISVSGDIGSSSNRIDKVINSGFGYGVTLSTSGNIYVANGIQDALGSQLTLSVNGASGKTNIIDASIGSATNKLTTVGVFNASAKAIFSGTDIYTNAFTTDSTVTATINNTGVISLGGITNAGTMILNNNVTSTSLSGAGTLTIASGKTLSVTGAGATTFTTGNIFNVIVNTAATDPNLKFTGGSNVSFNSGTVVNFDYLNGSGVSPGGTYNLLTTTGTLSSNNLSAVTLTDNSFLLNPVLSISGGNSLVVTSNIDTANKALLTGDKLNLLNNILSQSSAGGNMASLNNALLNASSQNSLEQSLGDINRSNHNMLAISSINISNKMDDIINARLSSIGIGGKAGFSSGNNVFAKNSVWGQVFTGISDQKTTSKDIGYNSSSFGLVFGSDVILKRGGDRETVLGIAASYGITSADSTSNQNTDINSYQLSVYNNNFFNSNKLGYYNDNIINLAYHSYDSNRQFNVGSTAFNANSSYAALQYGVKTGIGYNLKIHDKYLLSPNVSIKYSVLNQDDYQETGAGNIGLVVSNEAFRTLVSDVGFRVIGQAKEVRNTKILPELKLSWSKNLITDGQESSSRFISGGSSFSSNGGSLDENFLNLGLRFNAKLSPDSSLIFDYDLQKGKSFSSHVGSLKYRISF